MKHDSCAGIIKLQKPISIFWRFNIQLQKCLSITGRVNTLLRRRNHSSIMDRWSCRCWVRGTLGLFSTSRICCLSSAAPPPDAQLFLISSRSPPRSVTDRSLICTPRTGHSCGEVQGGTAVRVCVRACGVDALTSRGGISSIAPHESRGVQEADTRTSLSLWFNYQLKISFKSKWERLHAWVVMGWTPLYASLLR